MCVSLLIRYEAKRMQQFVKNCAPLWFVREEARYEIAALLPNALQFSERTTFSRQKAPQSKDCSALQDGALRHGHQSAAHTVGEERRTCRHVFKCRCDTFVSFFLTLTVANIFGGLLTLLHSCYRYFGVCVCVSVCV